MLSCKKERMNVSFTMSYTFTLSIRAGYTQGFYSTDQYYCRYREHEIDSQSINSSEKNIQVAEIH